MYDSIVVAEPTVESGPTGEIVSPALLAEFVGGVEVSAASALLTLTASSATQIVENILGYSFRHRLLAARIDCLNVPVYLPWGPASSISVDKGTVTSNVSSDNALVTIATVTGADEPYTIKWEVGSSTVFPDSARMAVLRVANTLFIERTSIPESDFRSDVLAVAGQYKARSDWL